MARPGLSRPGVTKGTLRKRTVRACHSFLNGAGATAPGVEPARETPKALATPESAAFDPARGCFYVSNYDPADPSQEEGRQSISKIGADGLYLVSRNDGRLFRVDGRGVVVKLLDTSVAGRPIADFCWAEGRIVFPTFTDDRVVAYALGLTAIR